jgi:phosphatidylglycerophosphatase A
MKRKMAWILGTFFGTGRSPLAPGTVGSAGAVLVLLLLPASYYTWLTAGLFVLATAIGPWLADVLMAETGTKDPGFFVLDECAGMWLAALRFDKPSLTVMAACFFAFRAFDVIKPWPVGRLEALPGGIGVVLDDVAAGALALATTVVGARLLEMLLA